MDVHVDAASKNMAAELAEYLVEGLKGSATQTLSLRVANVPVFASEYAKVSTNLSKATVVRSLRNSDLVFIECSCIGIV